LSRHDNQIARHENIACVTVAARQSSPRRDRQIGQPVRRNASIQIVALQDLVARHALHSIIEHAVLMANVTETSD